MLQRSKYAAIAVFLSAAIMMLLATTFTGSAVKTAESELRLPVYNTADFTPVWREGDGNTHTISPFRFTDQSGNSFGSDELNGKIYVVDFFFTSCPGLCPILTANLGSVQKAFKDDPNVMLVSFSVTPETDSSSVLKKYADSHSIIYDKWRLLTGSRKEIYTLARQSYFADEDLGLQLNENDFLHTENILLIDSHQRIRGLYKGTLKLEIEKLVREIGVLEKEN